MNKSRFKRGYTPTTNVLVWGYTLVEILVVMTIIGVVFGVGFASFRGFARRQAVASSIRALKADLRLAQAQALAGKKPDHLNCNSPNVLDGYNFEITASNEYRVRARCSGGDVEIKQVQLANTAISAPTPNPILFKVLGQGTNIAAGSQAYIVLAENQTGFAMAVSISSSGEIIDAAVPTPTPPTTPTPTPTPGPPPTPTPTPTSTPPPGPPWWDTAWPYRKEITIASSQVTANLTNFPVLVSMTDADLSSKAQTDGDDIAFTDQNAVKLDHEIERYTSGTGNLVAWVEVASLSSSTDTILYMYYGNGTATNQQNVAGSWDSNFKGVWHLKEDPSGAAPQILDSTSNNNDGTSQGSMTASDQVAGIIDGSLEFDGASADNDYINVVDNASLDITNAITFELWVNPDGIDTSRNRYVADKNSAYFLDAARTHSSRGHLYLYFTGSTKNVQTGANLTAGSWNYLVGTYDSSERVMRIYVNGVESNTKTLSGLASYTINTSTSDFKIGRRWNTIDGKLDEVRLSDIKRSADWIITNYNNQSSPSNFYGVGSEETST